MRFFCVKLKTIRIVLLVLLVAILLTTNVGGNSVASVYFGKALRKVPIYYVNTSQKEVSIGFDAAWGADKTEKIMDICDQFGIKATFFLVGFWVEKYPDITKKIAERGFEIGTHSNSHPDMTKLSQSQQELELSTSINLIEKTAGTKVKLFRPPYGAYNDLLLTTAENMGLVTIQWDVDSLDWKGLSAMEITTRILNGVRNGSIILCHNNSEHILDALPIFLDRLQKRGYSLKPIGDLILKENYVIDNNGMQTAKI